MKYPLEFYHYQNDWQLRDAEKVRVLKIDIEGLDYIQQNAVIELLEKSVKLLNLVSGLNGDDIAIMQKVASMRTGILMAKADHEAGGSSLDTPKPAGNGSNLASDKELDSLRFKLVKTDFKKLTVLEKRLNRFKEKMAVKYADD